MVETKPKKEEKPKVTSTPAPEQIKTPEPDMIQISKKDWNDVQETLKMLKEVADKGRVYNYESSQPGEKSMQVNVSVYDDKYVIGWETKKDVLIKHPSTGLTVGEEQIYDITLLDKDNAQSTITINGYVAFSNLRYDKRVACNVIGKREGRNGKYAFEVILPDGREILLNSEFVN